MKFVFVVLVLGLLLFPMKTRQLITAQIHGTFLELEIARSSDEKTRGLSGRAFLPESHGMLFVYEPDTQPVFWMKDMKFPIDIVWISGEKKVVGIEADVSPNSYPERFRPELPVIWVLEVNAGWAEAHGVNIGDLLELQ